ncbi:hypothetical protein NC651_036289 [Populus alba x Populus x berolinensis]|nr:hypothetical protein NC651_036289 [Populus alba x Populus x berolinensis]
MDFEQLSCVVDDLPPAKLRLRAKMEKALSLLTDSLGSTFLAQFWAEGKRGFAQGNLSYPHLCVPNSTLLEYRQLEGRPGFLRRDILNRAWSYGRQFPEWTSNVSYYRPDEYSHLSDAISCGVRGIIAFPVFDPDQPNSRCAVLELVTMEEKQDFDSETEKVSQALQAANLWTKLPRPRPQCFDEVQRAALTEIADVTRAVCQTHRLPLALTWIPRGHDDDILKLGDLRSWLWELAIERTACYADEEMQGFVHACEQLYLSTGQGAAGKATLGLTRFPSFEPDVKEKHVSNYPLAHHARKYNLNAAVAILLRSTGDDHIYILEFFLPILVKESSEQQDLVEKLKLTIKQTCKSLTMFPEEPSIRKRGSKVSKNNDKIEPAPDPDGNIFIERADNKRRKVSEVWKHFDKDKDKENGAVWAICKGCQKKYPGESTKGTSNLHKHLKSCSKKRQGDAKQHTLPSDLGGNFVFDQERSHLNFVRMIMKLGFPLDKVQNEFVKTFVCDLQPKFQLCSQDTVQADALSIYRQEKEKLMKYLDNLSSLFSITIDLQSYGDNKMTCCLTMHFIDDGWRMNKKILAFRRIEHAFYMIEAVKHVLVEWNIIKKVQFMFAEIAPPNSQMTREFRSKLLSQFPHMNGDLLCVSCYAQTLELLARDGFYEIKDVLNKIRGCIEYVKATPINQDKFQKATNHVKLQDMKAASHDDPTRWETTFVMLRSALELREAFTQLEQVDFDFKVNPSAEEWKMAMIVCECFKVIHKSLGSSSSSIDACFFHVCYIYKNLLSWEKSEHAYVCSMAKRMKVNLDRHWSEWSFAFGILLVLDPCRKLEFVQYGFELMYGSVANDMYVANLQAFRSKLTCMYNSYLASPARDISSFASYDLDSDIGNFRGFCEWHKQKHDGDVVDPSKSDLDRYLGEPLENRDKVSDVLAWWRVNAPRFPALGKMARDFLAIPISAILSKSTISGEATKVNPSFNGLGPEIIEAFICGQDWLESSENNSKEGKPGSSLVSTDVRFDSPGKQMSKYLAGPFTVSKPTSPEDLKLIQYVFDSSLSGSETIVQCKNYHLSRKELYSLRPETWLDDIVLSTISDAMTSVQRKMEGSVNWYLPIFFAANADDPYKCISFAKTHMIKENYMSNLLCCEKAFVPVFDEERSHFFLFVLQLKKQVVEIWDSLAASCQSDWVDRRLRHLLVSLDALFKDDIDQNYQKVWSFKDFRVERPSNVPQQQNGHDCGVYVIKFMLAPEEVTNPYFVFDSENERLEVVLRLLASDVNSCRNGLASKAESYYEQRFGNH